MKVCLVSHTSDRSGAARMLLQLVEGFKEREVECFVLLPRDGPLQKELEFRRIEYAIYPYGWWASSERYFRSRFGGAARLLALRRVVSQLWRWNVDIILSNSSVIPVGALAATVVGKPHVWYLHEFGREDHNLSYFLGFRLTCKLIARLSKLVIVNSRALEAHYSRYIPKDKIRMIYCGVESRTKATTERKSERRLGLPRLVLVGTCNPGKGQLVAIKALKHLSDQGVRAELILVGPTTNPMYLGELRSAVIEFGLEKYVSIVGHQDEPALIVAGADLVLMCSRSEAFGLVTVEGMKQGKAVVGARAGATAELVRDGFNGLLYALDDPSDLAAKVRYLLENPLVAKQMGENGRQWADEAFSVNSYINMVLNVLNDASGSIQRAGV